MGKSHFYGPIQVGPIKETNGSTLGLNVKNTGQVVMSQTYEYVAQTSTDKVATTIVIPAKSQIVKIDGVCTTTFDGTNETITMGTTSAAANLTTNFFIQGAAHITLLDHASFPGVSTAPATITKVTMATGASLVLKDVGDSDARLYIGNTKTGTPTAGAVTFTVFYIQANDLT